MTSNRHRTGSSSGIHPIRTSRCGDRPRVERISRTSHWTCARARSSKSNSTLTHQRSHKRRIRSINRSQTSTTLPPIRRNRRTKTLRTRTRPKTTYNRRTLTRTSRQRRRHCSCPHRTFFACNSDKFRTSRNKVCKTGGTKVYFYGSGGVEDGTFAGFVFGGVDGAGAFVEVFEDAAHEDAVAEELATL